MKMKRSVCLLMLVVLLWSCFAETQCQSGCSFGDFLCDNKNCIPDYMVCDDYNSCGDNSDEIHCGQFPCFSSGYEFTCDNGECIYPSWVCDGDNDCGDYSDERKCFFCSNDQFQCDNGDCITLSWACDAINDCGDNSDELYCNSTGLPTPPTLTPNATEDSGSDSTSAAAAIVIGVTVVIGVLTILLIACIMCTCISSCPLYAVMRSNRKHQPTATVTPTVYQPSPPQLSPGNQTTYPHQEMTADPPAIQGYPATRQQYPATPVTAATPYAGYSGQPVKQEFDSPYQRYQSPQAYPVPAQLPPPNVATK